MKTITFPFLDATVYFVNTKKGLELLKKVETGISLRPTNCHGYATSMPLDDRHTIIYSIQIAPDLKGKKYVNTVTHEISHIVNFMMEHHNFHDDELRSCLVGYLSEELLDVA